MYAYTAFGLTFESEVDLTPLRKAQFIKADVSVRLAQVSECGLAEPRLVKPFSQMAPDALWLHVPNVARFCVTNGNTIEVDVLPGADAQTVRLFLLGSCMGALLYQRNRLVIHGNAIRVGDECVVFAGASGNGKSTLAAAFHQRGYQILADDVSVVDEHLRVQPSYPQLKLWHDTATRLGIDVAGLNRIRVQVNKYAYPIGEDFCDKPLSVRAVYILNSHNEDTFKFEPVKGMAKFQPLQNQSYRLAYVGGLGLKVEHLKRCCQLANKVEVMNITRPNVDFRLDELVDRIEAHLNQPAGRVA